MPHDMAEALGGARRVLPGIPRRDDLVVRAADEVPPHDDVGLERLPAEEEERRIAVGAHIDPVPADAEIQQALIGKRGGCLGIRRHLRRAAHSDERVLPRRVERQRDGCPGGNMHLRSRDRGVHRGGRCHARERTDNDCRACPVAEIDDGEVLVAFERGGTVPSRIGQSDPQLERVEGDGIVADGVFRVGDAGAARHEIERSAPHDDVAAEHVAVAHVADERPGHRLQADVRMRFDAHLRRLRAETVEEAPRAHHRQRSLR